MYNDDMHIINLDEINSTSSYLINNSSSLEDRTIVFASYQTKGYGRYDRVWQSSKDSNLLFSVLIKDEKILSKAELISGFIPTVIFKYLRSNNISDISIKWPNDVYVKDKKICGIILNSKLPEYLVIGVGINVNEEILLPTATSIYKEKEKKLDISKEKLDICVLFDNELDKFSNGCSDYFEVYKSNNYLLNKTISFEVLGQIKTGIVTGINCDNKLIVNSNGKELILSSGEVNLSKR